MGIFGRRNGNHPAAAAGTDRPEAGEPAAPPWRAREQLFADRLEAGTRLADRLAAYRDQRPLVLGIPRGGVPVADAVAQALQADADIIVVRKVGALGQQELAVGAVTADGVLVLNDEVATLFAMRLTDLRAAAEAQKAEAQRREVLFRRERRRQPVKGRVVIVVDDGLATGATMRVAVRSLRRAGARQIVVAAPVGASDSCVLLRREADEVVCLAERDDFGAVGFYYGHFEPVDDAEVLQTLRRWSQPKAAKEGERAS